MSGMSGRTLASKVANSIARLGLGRGGNGGAERESRPIVPRVALVLMGRRRIGIKPTEALRSARGSSSIAIGRAHVGGKEKDIVLFVGDAIRLVRLRFYWWGLTVFFVMDCCVWIPRIRTEMIPFPVSNHTEIWCHLRVSVVIAFFLLILTLTSSKVAWL